MKNAQELENLIFQPEQLKQYLEEGGDPNASLQYTTILGRIIDSSGYDREKDRNSFESIKLLLEKGANPNIELGGRDTPLGYFYRNENTEMVEILLKHGARNDTCDKIKWGSENHSDLEMFKLFLSYYVGTIELSSDASSEFTHWFGVDKIIKEAVSLPSHQEQKDFFQKPDNLKALKKVKIEDLQSFYDARSRQNTDEQESPLDFKEVLATCNLDITLEMYKTILSQSIDFPLPEDAPQTFQELLKLRDCIQGICSSGLGKHAIISFLSHQSQEDSTLKAADITDFSVKYVNNYFSQSSEPFLSTEEIASLGQTVEHSDYA